jgi:hypothetical protein
MYPFPMTMGLGAHEPFPMQATAQAMEMGYTRSHWNQAGLGYARSHWNQAGLGNDPQAVAAPVDPPVNWLHIGGGALAGLAAGWFLYKK